MTAPWIQHKHSHEVHRALPVCAALISFFPPPPSLLAHILCKGHTIAHSQLGFLTALHSLASGVLHSKKAAMCQPGRRPPWGTEPADTLPLEFPACRTVRDKHLVLDTLVQHNTRWYFVLAVQVDQDSEADKQVRHKKALSEPV